MERLHNNKRILDKEILVLEEKGWVGGKKQRQLGDGWNKHRWEELINDLAEIEMIGSTWRETHRWKGLAWQSWLSRRIGIHIEIWEHHLEKVWNQHLTLKQLEYHNWKQNKGLACRISQKQTYDRSHIVSCVCWKDILGATWIPAYKLPKLSGYAIRCWGYRGRNISHPN